MPRIRNVKPELWAHEVLHDTEAYTGLPVVLGYISLWNFTDKSGFFKWRSRTLKSQCMPLRDDVNFCAMLDCLHSIDLIRKYEFEGEMYGFIPTFRTHQAFSSKEKCYLKINIDEAKLIAPMFLCHLKEKYKLKGNKDRKPACKSQAMGVSDAEQVWVRAGTGKGQGDIGQRTYDKGHMTSDSGHMTTDKGPMTYDLRQETNEGEARASDRYLFLNNVSKKYDDTILKVLGHWSKIMGIRFDPEQNSKINQERAKLIAERLKEKYSLDQCLQAITNCSKNDFNMARDGKNKTLYNDIEYIFSEKRLERHLNTKTRTEKRAQAGGPDRYAKYRQTPTKGEEIDVTPHRASEEAIANK